MTIHTCRAMCLIILNGLSVLGSKLGTGKKKCDDFLSNTDLHFEKMILVNSNMIRNGDKMEKKIRQYQTIDHDKIKKYLKHLQ